MASKYEIQLNFDRAKKEINNLDSAATDLYKLAGRKLNDTLKGISNGWKGDNASAFIRKGNDLENMISQTALDLGEIVVDMRNTLNRVYQAEMAALEIAKNRKY